MKKKLVLLLVVFGIFGIIIAGRFAYLAFQTTDGQLKVVSSPNSNVYLNNVAVGKTPLDQKVKEGEYLLKLSSDNKSTQSATFESKIVINKNSLTYVSQDIGVTSLTSSGIIFSIQKMQNKPDDKNTGEIEVQSEPSGATVYLDNQEHGNSALVMTNIEKGLHEITISSPGFFPRNEKVDVKAGYRVIAKFKLAIDPSHKIVDESLDKKIASDEAKITPTGTATDTKIAKKTITISETGTGFLRVRSDASTTASESARVTPGTKFELLEEKNGWYKIEYKVGSTGWVSAQYAKQD